MRRLPSISFNGWRRALVAALALVAVSSAGLVLSDTASSAATQYTAYVGGGGRGISVETFRPGTILVNEGDSIQFTNPYEEIHTVTFSPDGKYPDLVTPAGPPSAGGPPKLIIPAKVSNPDPPSGPAKFDGTAWVNSGIMQKGQSWTVTFSKQGAWKFICIVHPGMVADVQVIPAGINVPTQAQRDFEANDLLVKGIAAGERSAAAAKPASPTEVLIAASAGQSDVMRFAPARLQIGVGDTVNWKNDTLIPHTVTFLAGTAEPDLFLPEFGATPGPPTLVLNPKVLFPTRTPPSYDGSGFVNSGFFGAGPEAVAGKSFSLTFTKAGTYSYLCLLHDDQGMAGVIEVGPASAAATSGGIRPPSTGDAGLAGAGSSGTLWYGLSLATLVLGIGAVVYGARHRA